MNKTKRFNYNIKKHQHIIEYIEKQPNQSQYILNLVENDMKDMNLEEIVKKEVDKYLEETAQKIIKGPNFHGV